MSRKWGLNAKADGERFYHVEKVDNFVYMKVLISNMT